MNFTSTAIWSQYGFRIAPPVDKNGYRIDGQRVLPLEFENLNPHVAFTHCMTRWELFRCGLWFVKQSVRRWSK